MEAGKLPRRERERLAQRQEILAAALDLFSKKGFSKVSVQEIAAKAEFAIGTLYKFFRNKEELYRALVREKALHFHEEINKALREPDDEVEKLRSFVRTKEELFRAHLPMIRIYFSETQGARHNVLAGFDTEMRGLYQETMQALALIFESGMRSGRFRRIAKPRELAVALEGMTNALLFQRLDPLEGDPDCEDPEIILNILFQGLIAQIEMSEDPV